MHLLRDKSGVAAAEYALIVAVIGGAMAIAALVLGDSLSKAVPNAASFYGPNGVKYTCTANCQFEDLNFCSAHRESVGRPEGPVFSPALPPVDPAFCS